MLFLKTIILNLKQKWKSDFLKIRFLYCLQNVWNDNTLCQKLFLYVIKSAVIVI